VASLTDIPSEAEAGSDFLSALSYVTKQARHGLVSFLENDDPIGQCLLRYGEWAEGEVALLAAFIREGDTVLDIGANVGCHSIAFAQMVGGKGRVVAFEPQPHLHALLRRNAEQNNLSQLTTFCQGAGARPGELWIPKLDYTDVRNFGAVSLKTRKEGKEAGLRVPVTCIDDLALEDCRLLKIDVEGMELEVLKGSRETLKRHAPIVYAEMNSVEAGADLMKHMAQYGYAAFYHAAPAFNPDNFLGSEDNFLGFAHESNLLFLPASSQQTDPFPSGVPASCREVRTLDDLAREFMETPRWGDPETDTSLSLARRLAALQQEMSGLREETSHLQAMHDKWRQEAGHLRYEYERLEVSLDMAHAQRRELEASLAMRYGALLERQISRFRRGPLRPVWLSIRALFVLGRKAFRRATRTRRLHRLIETSGLFDRAYYATQTDEPVRDTIGHYLSHGSARGLKPNPLFDPDFYRATYPDVAQSGEEPLVHFLRAGAREGRRPNRTFHTSFYLAENRDVARLGLNPLAHFLSAGQAEGRRPNPFFDPSRHPGILNEIRLVASEDCPRILMISHVHGGGTERHIRDLATLYRDRAEFFYLIPSPEWNNAVQLSCLGRSATRIPDIQIDVNTGSEELVSLVRELNLSRLHIHHVMGTLDWLRPLVEALGLPFDVTLHDYYLLSSDPHLAGVDMRYGKELGQICGLVGLNDPDASLPTETAWRESLRWVFEQAQRIIVPSRDIQQRIVSFVPQERLIVASHPETATMDTVVKPEPLAADEALRIAVPGVFAMHKGADLVEACEIISRHAGLPIEFKVLGGLGPHYRLSPYSSIDLKGRYEEGQLDDLLMSMKPHLAWLPAQCPETYSYTLSHCLHLGLPVVASDLGAFPERLAGRDWSWTLPWDMPAEDCCAFFMTLRRDFLSGKPPRRSQTPTPADTEAIRFYETSYLYVDPARDRPSGRSHHQ